ncbi:MAG: hypothetical protein ACI9LM_001243 [Alteromonadaceae bacterium]|jgi:hypothetical protein
MDDKMKNILMALSTLLLISTPVLAENANQVNINLGYQNADEVFQYGEKTQQIKKSLENSYYQVIECRENMIYYFIEPSENLYKKSSYACSYKVPSFDRSFDSDYAELSIDIYYNKNFMVHNEGNVTVRYWTVY